MRCYVCNKEIIETPTNTSQCKAHGEHIIHNGIRGKLIANNILCKECGGLYSSEDAKFCNIFAPFIAALNSRLIPADHGKGTPKKLLGTLFASPDFCEKTPKRIVTVTDGVVAPIEPFHEIVDNHIFVYAERHRIKNYINVLTKKLQEEGKDINNYTIKKVTDIHDKGYLAYYFSNGNPTFNEDFKKGMVKIATEYALYCGVPREHLKSVLRINSDSTSYIDSHQAKFFPFIPTTLFDIIFEDHRYMFEEGYPSHILKLFTMTYNDNRTVLYCYIDLFSTFQYYVVLDEDYQGNEINEMYTQCLFPNKEKIDVTHFSPKELSIIIKEYGIDMSMCPTTDYVDQVQFIQECIRKYPVHTYDFGKVLNCAYSRIYKMIFLTLLKQSNFFNITSCFANNSIPSSIETIIKASNIRIFDFLNVTKALHNSISHEHYRKFGFEVLEGDIRNFSSPDESLKILDKNRTAVQEYTNTKFSHLCCLCYNPTALK